MPRSPARRSRAASGGQAPSTFTVETWSLDRIRPYERNPRVIPPAAIAALAVSLQSAGYRRAFVVDKDGVLVVGHTMLLAARQIGWTTGPVHVAADLSPAEIAAHRLRDNRTSELTGWDLPMLQGELGLLSSEGYDVGALGWDATSLGGLMGTSGVQVKASDADEQQVRLVEPALTQPGDVIQLGAHRLICGDATLPATWGALLGGKKADAIWTDPPYGVSYVGGTKDKLTIENDDLDIGALAALLRSSLGWALSHVRPGGAVFVAGPHGPPFFAFTQVATELGFWRQTLIWKKTRFVLGRQDFQWQHEVILAGITPASAGMGSVDAIEVDEFSPVLYGWVPGATHEWAGGRKASTVIEHPSPTASRDHPTMKPVGLIEPMLRFAVPAGRLVLDPFLGSGSTLLAAEASGRVCYGIELSPHYCDVVVRRWEELTQLRAVRPRRKPVRPKKIAKKRNRDGVRARKR